MTTEISSKTNEHFRRWIDLSSARGIKKHNEFILMGEKLVAEFLKNPSFKIVGEIISEGHHSLTRSLPSKVPVFKLPPVLFKEVDVIGTHHNLLVLEPRELPEFKATATTQGLEVICPLGDPSNLGALARSALAFGASKMILTEESCHPFHPKAIKASAGALLSLPLFKTGKLTDLLQNNDSIWALDMKGESVSNFPWPQDIRLVLGEEGPGLSGLRGLKRLSVPTQSVESLNAMVAASIAMYSYSLRK